MNQLELPIAEPEPVCIQCTMCDAVVYSLAEAKRKRWTNIEANDYPEGQGTDFYTHLGLCPAKRCKTEWDNPAGRAG